MHRCFKVSDIKASVDREGLTFLFITPRRHRNYHSFLFLSEHGQKFPGLRPTDAAGLNGSQQKWAETRPGGACVEASADRIQPRASEECQTALRVAFPQNVWVARRATSRRDFGRLLVPQLIPQYHISGRRLPQRHFQTNPHTSTRGQTGATTLLPNFGDAAATNRAK